MKLNDACLISHHNFINITEYLSFASLTVLIKCKVVRTEDHILCRNCNRLTVRRLEKVACCEHKESCFCLCLCRKRYMDSHLVAVKVSVVCCTSERMKFKSTTFNKNRLKCLNTKTVKCRRTVEENGVSLDYNFKCVPNIVLCTLNSFSC